jgi:hypothetical protein
VNFPHHATRNAFMPKVWLRLCCHVALWPWDSGELGADPSLWLGLGQGQRPPSHGVTLPGGNVTPPPMDQGPQRPNGRLALVPGTPVRRAARAPRPREDGTAIVVVEGQVDLDFPNRAWHGAGSLGGPDESPRLRRRIRTTLSLDVSSPGTIIGARRHAFPSNLPGPET